MSKSQKLYISFAADDNVKGKDKQGWVDEFTRFLDIFLKRFNRKSPEFIPLQGGATSAVIKFEEGDGLIIVLSDNYIKNNIIKKDSGLLAGTSSAFKVILSPIKRNMQPKELRTLNEFHYFTSSPVRGEAYVTLSSSVMSQEFWLKTIDLAFEISRMLYKGSGEAVEESGPKIFLAETSYDPFNNRDEIKRELRRHGYTVLPAVPFSSDLSEFKSQVTECISQADLTIQIIGEEYGETMEGSDKSIIEIQNDLANEFYQKNLSEAEHALHRLIWMPLHLKPKTDQQKLYLDRLLEDITSTAGAEIVQTPLEILKTVIHGRLQIFDKEKHDIKKIVEKKSDHKSVYVLFDRKDASDVEAIVSDLNARKIEVILTEFEGKQIDLLKKHRDHLITSDGVILYANNNLNWVNSKLNDVIKAPGFGKPFPFEAKGIYIKDGSIPKDKIPNFGDLIMINRDGDKKKGDLGPFLDKIAMQ